MTKHVNLTSRLIRSVYYNDEGYLRLVFATGEERIFRGVPETIVEDLIKAPSPGRFYIETIRQKFERVAVRN